MARWLVEKGVRSAAMQSTGVYWMPVFEILEQHGLEVFLVNAQHTKNAPGRGRDVEECQWLLKLHAFGLLNNSFQPTDEIRVRAPSGGNEAIWWPMPNSAIQRIQKVLIEMNVQLSIVLSDISGVSGMNIIQAILHGERDPWALAALVTCGVKAPLENLAKSLKGTGGKNSCSCSASRWNSTGPIRRRSTTATSNCGDIWSRWGPRWISKHSRSGHCWTAQRPDSQARDECTNTIPSEQRLVYLASARASLKQKVESGDCKWRLPVSSV
jgi:hypothetical protein